MGARPRERNAAAFECDRSKDYVAGQGPVLVFGKKKEGAAPVGFFWNYHFF